MQSEQPNTKFSINDSIVTQKKKSSSSQRHMDNFHCLSNIIQLTQENQPHGNTLISQHIVNQKQIQQKLKQMEVQNQQNKQSSNRSCLLNGIASVFRRGINCLEFTCNQVYNKVISSEINIEQSQISQILDKMRKKKSKKISLLPELENEKDNMKTLVLDLEETLIFSTFKKPPMYDFCLDIEMKGIMKTLYVTKRFGLDSFLFQMSKNYQLVIFSSLKAATAQKILQKLDPKKLIKYCLSREHCIVINRSYYIKSVKDLGRNPKNVIVVDTQTISASLNTQNLYKIQPFKGSQRDRKLVKLGYFLKHIHDTKEIQQITPVEMNRRQFQSKEIKIQDKNINQNNKFKKNQHHKKNCQLEHLASSHQPQETSTRIFVAHS